MISPLPSNRYQLKQVAVVEIPEDQPHQMCKKTVNAVKQYKVKLYLSNQGR